MKTKKNTTTAMQLPGALALAAAGASAASGATVQITFNNSYISSTGINNLVTDFGGDGINDLTGSIRPNIVQIAASRFTSWYALAKGSAKRGSNYATVIINGSSDAGSSSSGPASTSMREFISVQFQDTNILSGQAFTGWLDVSAEVTHPGEKRITVNRLIFDNETGGTIGGLNVNSTYATYVAPSAGGGTSAVPEASTSLGLLALGAGGLLTRRRQKRAA